MASFVLSLHSSPSALSALQALSRFAQAALKNGHRIDCVFLYQDGVYHAQEGINQPTDQLSINQLWLDLKALSIPLLLCVTAAENRGVAADTGLFDVAGLAEFAMKTSKADKWVQFK